MSRNSDARLEREAVQGVIDALDNEADQLNDVERARLSAARHRALDRKSRRGSYIQPWHSVAAAAALVAVIGFRIVTPSLDGSETTVDKPTVAESSAPGMDGLLSDLPLLAAGDEVDFYQDLDFLMWLENNNDNAG